MSRLARALIFAAGVLVVGIGWALATSLLAGSTQTVPYSGVLESSGAAVEGTVALRFELYDAPTGGTLLWSETHDPVTVSAGRFTVRLGETSTLDVSPGGTPLLRRSDIYLGVVVVKDNGVALAPEVVLIGRQALGATTYAWGSAPGRDFDVDANLAVGGNVSVGGAVDVAGALNVGGTAKAGVPVIVTSGAISGLTLYDRDQTSNAWVQYVLAGKLRFWQGGDKLAVNSNGDLEVTGRVAGYDSGWVFVSSGQDLTFTHGLGAVPTRIEVQECGAVSNYSSGCKTCSCARVVAGMAAGYHDGTTQTNPVSTLADATTIKVTTFASWYAWSYYEGGAWHQTPDDDNNNFTAYYRVYAWR